MQKNLLTPSNAIPVILFGDRLHDWTTAFSERAQKSNIQKK